MTRDDALQLDAKDPLSALREQFSLPEGRIYLDGNSLGALPRTTAARVREVIEKEWGTDLIESWNKAGWIDAPRRLGDRLAPLIGARQGEVDLDQSLQGAARGAFAAAGPAPQGGERAQQFPDRPLHRRFGGARAWRRAGAGARQPRRGVLLA